MNFQNPKEGICRRTRIASLIIFGTGCFLSTESAFAERRDCHINWNLFTCQPATFSPPGKTAVERAAEERAALLRTAARRRATAWPTEFVRISKNMKHPNGVKIPFAQAPEISADTRKENGRRVCEHRKDKGNKSKQSGKNVHIDRECCLDPDEIPNPRCYYPKLGPNNSPTR